VDSLFETLKNLGAGRLAVMLLTFFGLVIFFIFISIRSNTPGMTLLYGSLSTADSTEIAAKLDVVKIPYKLSDDGAQVLVPQKEVGKARIILAQEGLPHQGSVGYEIFDQKQTFGTTSFVQNINQVRALEGELSRTIGAITSIRSARVHLVLPQRELFSKENNPASASVFVNLRNSESIGAEQVQAIQHLVAAAVPRLKTSNVAIIDQSGNMLAHGEEDTGNDSASARSGDEMRRKYETRLTRSIEDMVGRIVGYGKVRATVTAEMNFDVVNRNSESYNPEGQVIRSTQTTNEENVDNSGSDNNNAVTVENNLPGLPGGANKAGSGQALPSSKSNRTEEVTNYEISKTIESMVRASGQVQKISVAVLVDGRYEPDAKAVAPKNATKDWAPQKKYAPRDQAELEKISSLIKSAMGYDESRGDTVQVVNMQFIEETIPEAFLKDDNLIMGFQKADLLGIAETFALSVVAVLVILLVLRPLASHIALSSSRAAPSGGSTLAEETAMLSGGGQARLSPPADNDAGPSELESMINMSQVEGKVKASSVQKISELVTNHPAETVAVIRTWMSQES